MKKILLLITLLLPVTIKTEEFDSTQNNEEIILPDDDIENFIRAESSDNKNESVWTEPLIIDKNNNKFDNTSVIKLKENVIYKPSQKYIYPSAYYDYPAAIIIAKDNTTVDLAGFNLSLDPSSRPNFMINQPIYGIAIVPGIKNIKIISTSTTNQKGSISGFSGFAIYIYGVNQSLYSFDPYLNMIKNIIIDNLLITHNDNGIHAINTLDLTITNTNIIYNFSLRTLYGIYCLNVLNGLIDTCKINQNFSHFNIYGIYLEDTIDFTVQNNQINTNRSIKSGNAVGINLTSSSSATSSYANHLLHCKSDHNLCSFVTGKKSIGFNIENQSNHNIIENCSSIKNSHSPIYSGSQTPSISPQGIGFQFAETSNSNKVHNNQSGYHDAYGFYDKSSNSTSFYTNNIAMFNQTANYSVTIQNESNTEPLSTIILYQDDLSSFNYTTPTLSNIEIQAR